MHDPASLEIGATQKGGTPKQGVGDAPSLWGREEEQALSPILVGDIDPVLACFRFERRSLQQSLAVPQEPFSTSGWNGTVRGEDDLPSAEREGKKRIRPNDKRAKQQNGASQGRAGPQEC